jgi:putative endonuclease
MAVRSTKTKKTGAGRRKDAARVDLLSPTDDLAFYVYIAARNRRAPLKIGATGNLAALAPLRLLWFERLDDIPAAMALAERIARWPREWRLRMIARTNPEWRDLVAAAKT